MDALPGGRAVKAGLVWREPVDLTLIHSGKQITFWSNDQCAEAGGTLGHWQLQITIRTETDTPAVMRTGVTEWVVGGRLFKGNVLDDIGAVRDFGEIFVHCHPDDPVRGWAIDTGCRVDIDGPIVSEVRIDSDTVHPGLTLTDQIV